MLRRGVFHLRAVRQLPKFVAILGSGLVVASADSKTSPSKPGRLMAWGSAQYGQLGLGNEVNRGLPTHVEFGLDIAAIAAGDTNAALLTRSGEVYTWGRGQDLALGHGEDSNCHAPKVVDVGAKVKAVDCSGTHCAAVTENGAVITWGLCALGGRIEPSAIPGKVAGLDGVVIKDVACGRAHTLALSVDGGVYAWGKGYDGALGLGGKEDHGVPVRVNALENVRIVQAAAGNGFSILLSDRGEVFTCGSGEFGQTGHGSSTDRYLRIPVPIRSLASKRVVHVAAGPFHAACCTEDGQVFTWGLGLDGQIGNGSASMHNTSPQHVQLQGKFCQVSCGAAHTAARTQDGKLYIWGRGRDGQLGQTGVMSPAARREFPVEVGIPDPVTQVRLGGNFSLALVQ